VKKLNLTKKDKKKYIDLKKNKDQIWHKKKEKEIKLWGMKLKKKFN
jgi:hypothetical protein